MKDYSAMSDFEINCHVAEKAGIGDSMFFSFDESELAEEDPKKRGPIWNVPSWIQVKSWMPSKGNCFNPCNNPADAWPIIFRERITLTPKVMGYEWDAISQVILNDDIEHLHTDKNPIRAAMIVFLMMKDREVSHA